MNVKKRTAPKKRVSTEKRNSRFVMFLRRIFFTIFVIALLVGALYFFVLPSIVNCDTDDKNIVIVSDRLDVPSKYIYFAHISSSGQKSTVLRIDSEQSVEVPGGYGEYPLQSMYQLLLIDKKEKQFMTAAYSQLFGIPVDTIVAVADPLDEIEGSEFSAFFFSSFIKQLGQVNLDSVGTLLYLHYRTKEVTSLSAKNLADVASYQHEFSTVSSEVSQYCSVAVINATGENGVARKVGDVIENSGAVVVRVDDIPQVQEQTKIFYGEEPVNCIKLVENILGIFPQRPEVLPLAELEDAQQYRAKVVVIVGK